MAKFIKLTQRFIGRSEPKQVFVNIDFIGSISDAVSFSTQENTLVGSYIDFGARTGEAVPFAETPAEILKLINESIA